jgi:carbonic anhydrase
LEKLIAGHQHFLADIFPERREEFHLLAEGQKPEILFLTCADSRVVPDLILQTQPGDLFICRNAGNVIPRDGKPAGGVSATLEYAVQVLRVRHLIVCGHSDCGVMSALMNPDSLDGMPFVRDWLRHVEPAWKYVSEANLHADKQTLHTALVHANIHAQLDHLRTHACVQQALAEERLQIHGWYYDLLSGRIERYDEAERRFVPLV